MMYQGEQNLDNIKAMATGLQDGLQKINHEQEANLGPQSDALLRLLRQWASAREQHHLDAQAEKLAQTFVDLDSKLLGTLILKLVTVEKSLKELMRIRKRQAAGKYISNQSNGRSGQLSKQMTRRSKMNSKR